MNILIEPSSLREKEEREFRIGVDIMSSVEM